MCSCNRLAAVLAFGGSLAAGPLQFRTRELPRAVIGAAYHAVVETQVDGRCPESDVVLEVAPGSLPRGVELSGNVLMGVPREFGVFRMRIRAVNGCAAAAEDLALEVTGKPILRAAPEELVFEYREGDPLPQPQSMLVSGSWPDLAYAVAIANGPWLRFHANQGATPPAGSPYSADSVFFQVQPGGLAPGVYRSVIRLSTGMGANMPEVPVTLRVLAK